MNRNIVLAAVFGLLLMAVAASAQDKAVNFSGHWELDVSKSKLDDRARIEAMTLNVTQTDKEIKVETITKRAPRPEGAPGGAPGGRMGGGGGGFGGGDGATTYSLDGKEATIQQDSPMGQVPVRLNAKFDAGKLRLSSSRTISGPNGEMSITTKETWTLSADGNTLTVNREQSSPRGTTSWDLAFNKK